MIGFHVDFVTTWKYTVFIVTEVFWGHTDL